MASRWAVSDRAKVVENLSKMGICSTKQKYVLPETRHCLHGNCKAESSRWIETISYLVNQCMVEGNQNGNIMTFPSRQ